MSAAAPRRSARIAAKQAAAQAAPATATATATVPTRPVAEKVTVAVAPVAVDSEVVRSMIAEATAVRNALLAARTREQMAAAITPIDSIWRKAMDVYEYSMTPMFLSDIKHHVSWSTMPLDEEHAWAVDAANAFINAVDPAHPTVTLKESVHAATAAAIAALEPEARKKDIGHRKKIVKMATALARSYKYCYTNDQMEGVLATMYRIRDCAMGLAAPGMESQVIDALINEIEASISNNCFPPLDLVKWVDVFYCPA